MIKLTQFTLKGEEREVFVNPQNITYMTAWTVNWKNFLAVEPTKDNPSGQKIEQGTRLCTCITFNSVCVTGGGDYVSADSDCIFVTESLHEVGEKLS